ncbi:MAG: VCBS repeat-containing protein, partial [Planctomycetaceae bacterium]|nr:VCBS repeat-containing protein [Planctomycetaceae bacterium]
MPRRLFAWLFTLGFACVSSLVDGGELSFRPQQLPTSLTVGYAVRLVDMNNDGKQDIVIVDSKRFVWLENPTWREHLMHEQTDAKFDNVCFAPADINGDGKLDFAVGRDWQFTNTRTGGTVGWLEQGQSPADLWRYHPVAEEPTTHRIRWADVDADGRPELIVAPLKGKNTTPPNFAEAGVRLLALEIPADPARDPWP